MTNDQVRDKAYRIATGNHLTKALTYKQFQNLSTRGLNNIRWEQVETWDASTLIDHIAQIAEAIIREFSNNK